MRPSRRPGIRPADEDAIRSRSELAHLLRITDTQAVVRKAAVDGELAGAAEALRLLSAQFSEFTFMGEALPPSGYDRGEIISRGPSASPGCPPVTAAGMGPRDEAGGRAPGARRRVLGPRRRRHARDHRDLARLRRSRRRLRHGHPPQCDARVAGAPRPGDPPVHPSRGVRDIAFHPGGGSLATACKDGVVPVRDLETGTEAYRLVVGVDPYAPPQLIALAALSTSRHQGGVR